MEKKSCRWLPSLDKSNIFRKNDLGYDIQQIERKYCICGQKIIKCNSFRFENKLTRL
jgi:hypothetical protein